VFIADGWGDPQPKALDNIESLDEYLSSLEMIDLVHHNSPQMYQYVTKIDIDRFDNSAFLHGNHAKDDISLKDGALVADQEVLELPNEKPPREIDAYLGENEA
jgi:hypothetical protein